MNSSNLQECVEVLCRFLRSMRISVGYISTSPDPTMVKLGRLVDAVEEALVENGRKAK